MSKGKKIIFTAFILFIWSFISLCNKSVIIDRNNDESNESQEITSNELSSDSTSINQISSDNINSLENEWFDDILKYYYSIGFFSECGDCDLSTLKNYVLNSFIEKHGSEIDFRSHNILTEFDILSAGKNVLITYDIESSDENIPTITSHLRTFLYFIEKTDGFPGKEIDITKNEQFINYKFELYNNQTEIDIKLDGNSSLNQIVSQLNLQLKNQNSEEYLFLYDEYVEYLFFMSYKQKEAIENSKEILFLDSNN
jgi:hypothetical protein